MEQGLIMADIDSVTIQRARAEDATSLTDICKRAFHSDMDFGTDGTGGPPGYDKIEWNSQRISSNFVHYYKILDDEQVVGGFISGWRREAYHVCERIFIDPDNQRTGLGLRAFSLVWDEYPEAQLWTLGTPEWNIRTKNFYEKLGFVQIGFTYDVPAWRGRFYEKQMTSERPLLEVGELEEGMQQVVVEGTITKRSPPRQVKSRTGEPLEVTEVELTDDSGSISVVLWNEQASQIQSDRIRIESGYVKSYRDELQLSVGEWGLIISLI